MDKIIRSKDVKHIEKLNSYGVCYCSECEEIMKRDIHSLSSAVYENTVIEPLSPETIEMFKKYFGEKK